MNASLAEMVLYGITALGVAVWVEGLRFLLATAHKEKKSGEEYSRPEEQAPANLIHGSVEVAGAVAELSGKAAALLAEKSVQISECSEEKIVFETPHEYLPGQAVAWPAIEGQLRFTPLSPSSTRVDYAIAVPRYGFLLILGFAFQVLGLLAIITGFLVIYFFVVPSPNASVRWQTLQMLQVIHLLWPPFLFAALYRKSASMIRTQFDTFIHNLPYLKG